MTTHDVHQCELVSPTEASAETSPFVLEFYMVQAIGFRGMAYRNAQGNWHNAFNHEALYGHIHILE